jgi:pimeloyl-ACP methyl ester carboxylesterase
MIPQGFRREEHRINGVRTVVYRGGRGRPLVYWHGGGTFHGIEFTAGWLDRCEVIAPYHPGWGESDDAPHGYSIHDYLLHYLELFERLGLERFSLAGISMGGWMAAEFAAAHGHLLDRLILAAPVGIPVPDCPITDLGRLSPPEVLAHLVHDLQLLDRYLPKSEYEATAFAAARVREAQSLARLAPGGPVNPGLEYWLHRLIMPTLLLWGRQDRVTPMAQSERWMKLLPNATLELCDNAGHLVFDESARARHAVADFLAG